MKKLNLDVNKETLCLTFHNDFGQKDVAAVINLPIKIELWNPFSGTRSVAQGYQSTEKINDAYVCENCLVDEISGICLLISDQWSMANDLSIKLNRKVSVDKGSLNYGVRLGIDFDILPDLKPSFSEMQYFAPPAIYDKNDLDDDGIDDYFLAQNRMLRDDRLCSLAFMAYHPEKKLSLTLVRADIPEVDEYPDRPNHETIFLHKTDVGSMGIWNGDEGLQLRAKFPFFEGQTSLALNTKDKTPWESFWPALTGESFGMSYEFRVSEELTFIDAMWHVYSDRMHELNSPKVELPAPAEVLAKYRTYAVDKYYMEKNHLEDPNEPAGYILNCHPQDGKQLCDIIQYGFTGQNTISAYCSIRQGYRDGEKRLIEHGLKTLDFFADRCHIKESGTFYNLYNFEKGQFDFWWTGLILPLSYAEGDELMQIMGPLYTYYEDIISVLKNKKGSYLRCMNEEAYGLILAYGFENKLGNQHLNWLTTAKNYGDFLVRTQADDGTWYRAYDTAGIPITEPEKWFGISYYEKKGSTSTSIPFLAELYKQTRDIKYLDAAEKASSYVADISVEQVRCCGGIHDSIFEKGVLVDNESTLYAMIAMNEMYKLTGNIYYLSAARRAAILFSSWIYLWDLPLPTGSTLQKYGFRTTGIGGCDIPSAGYAHPFENRGVSTLVEIAFAFRDEDLLKIAELTWHGCNQTVATPDRSWGYFADGIQEEGYLINWFMAEDPVFTDDTGFGHRWKGEGNKTCYPWISAVALISYWEMSDRFFTASFEELKKQYISKTIK